MEQAPRRRRKSSSNPITAVDQPETANAKLQPAVAWVGTFILKAVAFIYGFTVFSIFALRGLIEGYILKYPSPSFWSELDSERSRQWNLWEPHPSGLDHAFYTLESGVKLHYLTSADASTNNNEPAKKTQNVVIFLHGWPDTGALWGHVTSKLPKSLDNTTTFIAPDLPGFGGSDGFSEYGPNQVLTAVTEFCLAMREKYLDESAKETSKVIMVSFDWGAVIGYRLAAEAPQLADRFILCNAPLPAAALKNVLERLKTAQKMFSGWKQNPYNYAMLSKALSPLKPVFGQLLRSAYIFTFNLPWILSQQTVLRCNLWLLRFVNSFAFGHLTIQDSPAVIAELAGFLGPLNPSRESGISRNFGESTVKRSYSGKGHAEPLRYYRGGLSSKRWDQPIELALKLSALADYNKTERKKSMSLGATSQLRGALGAPATIIWGEKDPALDHRIMLEGIDEYLKRDSQVIRLPKTGHWVPKQGEGPAVVAAVVEWALGDEEKNTLVEELKTASASAKLTVAK